MSAPSSGSARHTDLVVLGAGAKGAAIAIKAHVLNSLGLGPISLTVVEAAGPAAAWRDGEGVSSSREVLGLSPCKDVGFPYQSARAFGDPGEAVDEAVLDYSWQRYLIEQGRYAEWIDAGAPSVQRRVFGDYLTWVLARARDGVRVLAGRVARVSLAPPGDRWLVDVACPSGPTRLACHAFVLTGQGAARTIPHELAAAPRVLDCESGRVEIARVPSAHSSEIAIVGGGESALSCLEFVRARRPDAHLTVYTASLPMSRVESFLENRVFSRPDDVGWVSLSERSRREFIARSDRGVFGSERVAPFAFDERCRFVCGRVVHLSSALAGRKVSVACHTPSGATREQHDYVINCSGFDPLEQLRALLGRDARAEVERQAGQLWGRAPDAEVAIGRSLELAGVRPRLHLPGVAALSQGPGFSTLGALGLLADRVLEPLLSERKAGAVQGQGAGQAPAAAYAA